MFCSTLVTNEFSQSLEFLCATRLDSARIVKNIARMIGEHKFIVDVVLASLSRVNVQMKRSTTSITNIHRRFKFELVGGEIRLADKSLDYSPPPLPDKSWGSPLYHRPIVESMSFLRWPFL
jgi:hypothetical protein